MAETNNIETATFGTGCFWCTEAIFQQLDGIIKVTSGYSGGKVDNPTYEAVCNGTTGHAECLNIEYDKTKISFDELIEVFWQSHDPTTLNRQGNDIGTQYRSVIFYHNEEQKNKAEKYKDELNSSGAFNKPIQLLKNCFSAPKTSGSKGCSFNIIRFRHNFYLLTQSKRHKMS